MICKCGEKMKLEKELGTVRWRCSCGNVIEYNIGGYLCGEMNGIKDGETKT